MPRIISPLVCLVLMGWLVPANRVRGDDCNTNGVPDATDIELGTSQDCNENAVPDECDIADGTSFDDNHNGVPDECDPDCNSNGRADFIDILLQSSDDCNTNGVPDECESQADCQPNGHPDICDLADGTSSDCNTNGIPDECETDCNSNGIPDECDLDAGTSLDCNNNGVPDECETDCNSNGIPDECDLTEGTSADCNDNTVPDECDIATGFSSDFDQNGVPDECDPDCNSNGLPDFVEIHFGLAEDCNDNGIPDECEPWDDCQPNGHQDICDIADGTSEDCNGNNIPDECDLSSGTSVDLDTNGVPDECEPDCNSNGVPDVRDILFGTSQDCNSNSVPDECDLMACPPDDLTCADCNNNGIPDGCETDCNTNGVPDDCDLVAIRGYNPILGTLPDQQGYALVHSDANPSPDSHLEDGALHQGPTALIGSQYYKASDLRVDFTMGFVLEAVLKVESSNYTVCYGRPVTGYCIAVTDDNLRLFYIWIGEDRIVIHNQYNDVSTGWSFDTTGPYRRYQFVVEDDTGTLFIDDELFVSVDVGAAGEATNENTVWFGDGTVCAQSETYLKSLVYHSPADPGGGDSSDCNLNGVPDECEPYYDCNSNGIQDICDIAAVTSQDCNTNAIPDDCELTDNDCNANGIPDDCELSGNDCNTNGIPDDCELSGNDCNDNSTPDDCDIATGDSDDCDLNGTPDECQPDCNTNGVADVCDIATGTSSDCTGNGTPDECEPDCNTNGVADSCDIAAGTSLDCTSNGTPDECEPDCNSNGTADSCDIAFGVSGDCNSNDVPDECDLADATSQDCNTNGIPDECDIAGGTSLDLNGDGYPDECEAVILVYANATGANDGTNWADAFNDLRDALAEATTNGSPTQIWVAVGVYTPAGSDGDRAATFQLLDQVKLYGGFAGDETDFDQRDPATNETVLSGDLNGNDGPDFSSNGENSYNVVTADGVDESAVLDGFSFIGGNANGAYPLHDRGAALYCDAGHPTVQNCVFSEHSAQYGAVFLDESEPSFTDCVFAGNSAELGGGLYCGAYSHPAVTNCTFRSNTATGYGGGLFSVGFGIPTLMNCLFVGNSATNDGGGAYLSNSSPAFTNCTFSGNTASSEGGGVYVAANGFPTLSNCIFWGNEDGGGTNESAQIHTYLDTAVVDHSCVQGGWTGSGGAGNIADDPRFIDPNGDDDELGTPDDNLRLSADSPCIDAGTNGPVNSNGVLTDLDDRARIRDGDGDGVAIVDMGAYELPIDCNTNGIPDENDIRDGTSEDSNSNGTPDECEAATLTTSTPEHESTLWRTANNFIRLTFDLDIEMPDSGGGQLLIDVMTNGGAFATSYTVGVNGTADFIVEVVNDANGDPRILDIWENGSVLTHKTWIAVRNTGGWPGVEDFCRHYPVMMGDVDNDGDVLPTDFGPMFPKIPTFDADADERADVNGDGNVLPTDFGPMFNQIPTFNSENAKPPGHDTCDHGARGDV